jgi:hypothetical protein
MVAAMTRPCGALTMEGRKHIKLVAGSVGAVVIVGAGVATAVIHNTGSTNGNGGAGATIIQETGSPAPNTSVVVSATPVVKARPNGGGRVSPGFVVSP